MTRETRPEEDEMHDDFEPPRDGLLERVRALADGQLSGEDADRLLRDASTSGADLELMNAFRDVHALTAVADSEPPPCRVTFADVEARIARDEPPAASVWRRPVWRAAAAVLLVGIAVVGAQLDWTSLRGDGHLTGEVASAETIVDVASLAASAHGRIDREILEQVEAAAAVMTDFLPFADGEPQWLSSLDEGRAVAKITGRPVLLFIHHPTCPLCLDLKANVFSDPDVQARLEEFVPVMVNVMEMPKELAPFLERGWPYLGALDADGDELSVFAAASSKPSTFRHELDDALSEFDAADPPAWGPTRALAMRWCAADQAAREADFGRARREFVALQRDDAQGAFGRAAKERVAEFDGRVRAALDRAAAADDAASSLREVSVTLAEMAGTPYESDLRAVCAALVKDGRFPRLRFTWEEVR